jgi:hypothetical protein
VTFRPIQTCFRLGSGCNSLTLPLIISRRLILQQARGQSLQTPPTACQRTVSCSISLPYGGSISPFPRGTISLSVTQEYLALRGGPRGFTRDFTCPMLLGIRQILKTLTTGLSPSTAQDSAASSLLSST